MKECPFKFLPEYPTEKEYYGAEEYKFLCKLQFFGRTEKGNHFFICVGELKCPIIK